MNDVTPFVIKSNPVILGIESSCDETSASVCSGGQILSNIIATQSIHEQYGGVVPELASRAHMQNILPVVDTALQQAKVDKIELDAIAYTQAPGLIGALLVGNSFAKSLALGLNIPLIEVHHMQAHVIANLIDDPKPAFPFLCLTVSGGHTQIVLAKSAIDFTILGETLDDAAGEAFDKSAKILGLPYPGGPLIDRYAKEGKPVFPFAQPQIADLNFSFSGIKTSILYFIQKQIKTDPDFITNNLHDLCASIQFALVETLMKKLAKAIRQTDIRQVCLAGGVSANSGLRQSFLEAGKTQGFDTFIPAFEYCTDNAAMIALTGHYKYLNGSFAALSSSPSARASWT